MATSVRIVGTSEESAEVVNKAVAVVHRPYPDLSTPIREVVYRSHLTNSVGSTDMRVNGSTTPVRFEIKAGDRDIFIARLIITIADATAGLSSFGAIPALANGCDLYYENLGIGKVSINGSLKTNYDFVRMCGGKPAFGTGADAFLASKVEGNSEGYICVLDFSEAFGIEHGVWLKKGTTDKLVLEIKDNTSGVDKFECVAQGKQLVEI